MTLETSAIQLLPNTACFISISTHFLFEESYHVNMSNGESTTHAHEHHRKREAIEICSLLARAFKLKTTLKLVKGS